MGIEKLQTDVVVGRMIDGALQTQVSVRGGNIVLGYGNAETKRGFEVAYTPKAIQEFTEILHAAAKVAKGH